MPKTATSYIGLGSNLGQREHFIGRALEMLNGIDGVRLVKTTALIETEALGQKDQPKYLNCVAKIETRHQPFELLYLLHEIEEALGRNRDDTAAEVCLAGQKNAALMDNRRPGPHGIWQPRTIDLDVLLYDQDVLEGPGLTIPHPQMHMRSFVMSGMCELDGGLEHPVLKRSMRELAGRLNGCNFFPNPSVVQLISAAGVIGVGKTTLAEALAVEMGCPFIAEAYDANPYLAQVYGGNRQLALESQMFFLQSRRKQLSAKNLRPGNTYISDYIFEQEQVYARRTLSDGQLAEYNISYRQVLQEVAGSVLVIYMTDSPQACMKRIIVRGRPYEKCLTAEMLVECSRCYDDLFRNWKGCPVIRIDVSGFDCLVPGNIKRLADEVRHYIWTSHRQ